MPERNPYLILGVDFASSGDDARRAFAHAARRIRRHGGAWEIEDLNWALHEVEALASNPADVVSIYRVPADPTVFDPAGEGLFRPPPVPLARRTPQKDERSLSQVRARAMRELNDLLLDAAEAHTRLPPHDYDLEPSQ
jgi:hypothetical protein